MIRLVDQEPTILDRARFIFRNNGENFDYILRVHITREDGYVFKGKNYLVLGWEDKERKAWVIYFAMTLNGMKLTELFSMLPHELPEIGFARGLRGKKDLKFYSTERLRRLCALAG